MAQAFRRLGSDVLVIDRGRALDRDEPEAAARAEGVAFHEHAEVVGASKQGDHVSLTFRDGHIEIGSHLLVAIGRSSGRTTSDWPRAAPRRMRAGSGSTGAAARARVAFLRSAIAGRVLASPIPPAARGSVWSRRPAERQECETSDLARPDAGFDQPAKHREPPKPEIGEEGDHRRIGANWAAGP